jgi:electron transport complex protein RnfB
MEALASGSDEASPAKNKYQQAQWAKQRYDARCLRKERETTEKAERAKKKMEALSAIKLG